MEALKKLLMVALLVVAGCGGSGVPDVATPTVPAAPEQPIQTTMKCSYDFHEPTAESGVDPTCQLTTRSNSFGLAVTSPLYGVIIEVKQPIDTSPTRTATLDADASMILVDSPYTCGHWSGVVTWVPGFSVDVQADCLDFKLHIDAFFAGALPEQP